MKGDSMSKKRGVVIGFVIALILVVAVLASAIVSHSADQITAGTFGVGNFTFNGSFSVQNSTGTSYFHVDSSSGYVGIGTASPTHKLNVVGNVNITGNITAENLGASVSLLDVYPIGAVYISVVATSPASLFGGTWEEFGSGRVLVGNDSGDTDFDIVEETGGAKTHTLTVTEMPSHTHIQNSHTNPLSMKRHNIADTGSGIIVWSEFGSVTTGAATATNQNTGGGAAHNNVQPYIVVYMWKRTA